MREAMRRNGSRPPRFETDEDRTYFFVELPIHPEYLEDHGPRKVHDEVYDGVHDEVHDLTETDRQILRALRDEPKSATVLAHDLGHKVITGSLRKSLARLEERGMVVLTIPEKPRSKYQKRQLTEMGRKATKRD